ncbi:maltose acetyltransferase domain-containing protein [Ramlibacter montanisoli]|uniref:Maltose/galactoside acetyltransferase domain-containing protein n=1 Tax=Ramlibacter montanisoli TaxID=2732512 RepID=A0A849KMW5_9BURK|nr:maltose acetyltransferase domain-containing protein [Ramlibacter montanisoli]NNU43109.1 hypothetical protein [Ramlibacter montanisoli]
MTSARQKMLAGELYDAQDSELVAGRRRARSLCARINALDSEDAQRRESCCASWSAPVATRCTRNCGGGRSTASR